MKALGYYNGSCGELEDMTVPMNDRVCYFGDGVYDATCVEDFIPFALEEHVDRLYRSAAALRIPVPMEKAQMLALLRELVKKIDAPQSQLYWQLTRGTATRSHAFPKNAVANLWVTVRPFTMRDNAKRFAAVTVEDTRYLHCNIKTLNLLPNVMASQQAAEAGAEEAIFHRGERVTECSHSNVHILKDGVLHTAPLDNLILPGITRGHILQICRKNNIPVVEEPFTVKEMLAADEVFFSSASAYAVAFSSIDGQPVGGRDPERMALLQREYLALVKAYMAQHRG